MYYYYTLLYEYRVDRHRGIGIQYDNFFCFYRVVIVGIKKKKKLLNTFCILILTLRRPCIVHIFITTAVYHFYRTRMVILL